MKWGKFAGSQKCHTSKDEGNTGYCSGIDVTVKILDGKGQQKTNHERANDISSLLISQDPSLSNVCVCTYCHETNIVRTCCILLKQSRYNMANDDVKQALAHRYCLPTAKEFVSRKCDKFLLNSFMPPQAVSSPAKLVKGMRRLSCCRVPSGKMYFLYQIQYGDNSVAHEVMQKRTGEAKAYVCCKSHDSILGSSLVLCLMCTQKVAKTNSVVLNPGKYPWHGTANIEYSPKVGRVMQYVCRGCHSAKSNIYVSAVRGVLKICASVSMKTTMTSVSTWCINVLGM